MKKRLLTLMAIVMALGMVFMAGPVWADAGNIGGTIGDVRSFDSVSVDAAMTGTFFSTIDAADYNTGTTLSASNATTVTVTANTSWEVTVAAGLDGNYFTTSPLGLGDVARTTNEKPLSELLIKVSNINEGTDANAATPAIDGLWGDLTAMTFAAQDLVTCASGNDSASWDIQYQMALDASKDTPGGYSCDITYTIQTIAD